MNRDQGPVPVADTEILGTTHEVIHAKGAGNVIDVTPDHVPAHTLVLGLAVEIAVVVAMIARRIVLVRG